MEGTTKPEKQQPSSIGGLQKVLIFLVVFAICVGFFVGLVLVRSRLNSLEETVDDLREVCKTPSSGSDSNKRNRRDTGSVYVSLEDVRGEIQTQLRSITAPQLCSPPDKICLAGPRGEKGEPGVQGRRGKRGKNGFKGDAGYPGLRGLNGLKGMPGMKGSQGLPGIQGEKGDNGAEGMLGAKGDSGIPGVPGVIGEPGIQGIPGMSGLKGQPGAKGEKGEPGITVLAS